MEDVAREAGVSRALVSIVFRNAPGASEDSRRRVLEAAEVLGYRRNSIASKLASRTTRTLGVFVFDMRNDLTADVFEGIQAEAERLDLGLVVGISDPTGQRDRRTLNDLIAARVDAIVLIACTLSGGELRALSEIIPLVSVTRHVSGIDSVVGDDAAGAEMTVNHLVSLGHQRIHMLAPSWRPSGRVSGYTRAMKNAGLRPGVAEVGYAHDDAVRATAGLLKRDDAPSAIFANNDVTAYAVLDALHDAHLHVPGDVAVAGYDNLRASATSSISLTSVDQHASQLGELGVRAAAVRIAATGKPPVLKVLAPELVVRRSTHGTAATRDRRRPTNLQGRETALRRDRAVKVFDSRP
jgi:DNA-binding LacI/PurR family transcriptional regulator